jgi:hypothetical protein
MHYYYEGLNPMSSISDEAKRVWDELNEKATIENDSLPIVEMYLENRFPKDYFKTSFLDMKRNYSEHIKNDFNGDYIEREKRDEFSVKEIYCIAFNRDLGQTPEYAMREQIESALDKLGFIKQTYRRSQGVFGQQTVYKRTEKEINDDDLPF